MHRQSRRFLESRDIIFDEGGTEKRYERIVLERATAESGSAADANPPAVNAAPTQKDSSDSESEQEIEGLLAPPLAPAPPSRPKRAMCTPICDDDPRYSISSYSGRKHPEHAKSAHLLDADPCTYREVMSHPDAAEWEVACHGKRGHK